MEVGILGMARAPVASLVGGSLVPTALKALGVCDIVVSSSPQLPIRIWSPSQPDICSPRPAWDPDAWDHPGTPLARDVLCCLSSAKRNVL